MVDKNHLYMQYEVSGMKVCCDNHGSPDDIRIGVVEILPTKFHRVVCEIDIVRIPSGLRNESADYSMSSVMAAEQGIPGSIMAQEMDIDDPVFTEPYIKGLRSNDLYIIKSIKVDAKRRGEGIGSAALEALPATLTRITNDARPVIVVMPAAEKDGDESKIRDFFEYNGFRKVHALSRTWYRC